MAGQGTSQSEAKVFRVHVEFPARGVSRLANVAFRKISVNSKRLTQLRENRSAAPSTSSDTCEEAVSVDNAPEESWKSARVKRKYSMHMRRPAQDLTCPTCGKVTKHPSKYAEHMRTHSGERPFRCEVCDASFAQAGTLKVHRRTHSGEKPFGCRYCEKNFTTTTHRNNHERAHHEAEMRNAEQMVGEASARHAHSSSREMRWQQQLGSQSVQDAAVDSDENENNWRRMPSYARSNTGSYDGEVDAYLDDEEFEQLVKSRRVVLTDVLPDGRMVYAYTATATDSGTAHKLAELACTSASLRDGSHQESAFTRDDAFQCEPPPRLEPENTLPEIPDRRPDPPERAPAPCIVDNKVMALGKPDDLFDYPSTSSFEWPQFAGTGETEVANGSVVLTAVSGNAVLADPRPPMRGRKRQDATPQEQVVVDYDLFEKALPVACRTVPAATSAIVRSSKQPMAKEPRNLDWIIDAVARGEPVEQATPHNRRKPKVHVCQYCGLRLKYPSKIAAHMRTHTNERPFVCDICGIGFGTNTTLRMHLRRHLNQKLFACPYGECGQSFINGGLLNAHIQSRHKGLARRFACLRQCGRVFKTNAERERHEQAECEVLLTSEYDMEAEQHIYAAPRLQLATYHPLHNQWITDNSYPAVSVNSGERELDTDVVVDEELVYDDSYLF